MIIRCSVCGNSAVSDKSGEMLLCKVCGSSALWEAEYIEEKVSLSCEVCGNPIDVKPAERYKCAVCGFGGIVHEVSKENFESVSDCNVEEAEASGKSIYDVNNILQLNKDNREEDTASYKPKAHEQSMASSETDDKSEERLSKEAQHSEMEETVAFFGESVHMNADAAEPKIETEIPNGERISEHLAENPDLLSKNAKLEVNSEATDKSGSSGNSDAKARSVHMNAIDTKPKNIDSDHTSANDIKETSDSKIVAFAANTDAFNSDKNERIKYSETGFGKIFIVPAPLGKPRCSNPDISFSMTKRDGKEVRFDKPVIDLSDKGSDKIASFNAVPYYMKSESLSLGEAFSKFKDQNKDKLCGFSILPYCLEDDLSLAEDLNCDFAEVIFADMLLPGVLSEDAVKCITKAHGIISRRSFNLYLIVKIGAISSADVIKALCLGADACSANGSSDGFTEELKEYCFLCAHGKISEFSRSDLKFK